MHSINYASALTFGSKVIKINNMEQQNKQLEERDNKKNARSLKNMIIERFNITAKDKKQLAFYLEYIMNGGNGTKAYQKVYGPNMNPSSAAVLASKLISKVNIGDLLDLMGHGPDQINEALFALKKIDPDKYLTHIERLKKWDKQQIEHSGSIQLPEIRIVTNPDD